MKVTSILAVSIFFLMACANHTSKPFNNPDMQEIVSKNLERTVNLAIFLPPSYEKNINQTYKILFVNDGQDADALQLASTLKDLYAQNQIQELIVVAIAAHDRIQEYGTLAMPDYKQRGSKAFQYNQFILEELKPFIEQNYRGNPLAKAGFIGFSLGGLSAFDVVWANSTVFDRAGVFSGALWWRRKAYEEGYQEDNDRIMHLTVRNSTFKSGLKMWFQAGTEDETSDRNNNGIIDAIDDTLDLIKELKRKGYNDQDIKYLEIEGGKHDQSTWAKAIPDFLLWAYPK